MPGLCGAVALDPVLPLPALEDMLASLSYARATCLEHSQSPLVRLGCAHLGTGGQRALFESDQAVVVFYGYLTHPAIPPGADPLEPAAAARAVHDRYLRQGEALLADLQGAFAFALWDKRTHSLLLATDRLGMRPLYYTSHRSALLFASEVKGLLAVPGLPRRLDQTAAAEFFHFRYILGERTLFEDIRLLPPASYMKCQDGKTSIHSYWQPVYPERYAKISDRECDRQVYEALSASVERMLRPDLRYGLSLSSGMDSRWIAALLGRTRPDAQAFTFGGAVTSDEEFVVAERVAAMTGLQHHQMSLAPNFVAEQARRIAYISDGMHSFVDSQEFPLVLEMSKFVDVAVGGYMGSGCFDQNPFIYFVPASQAYAFRERYSKSYLPDETVMQRIFGAARYKDLAQAAYGELRAAVAEAPAKAGFQMLKYESIRQRQRRFTFYAQLLKTPYVDSYHPIADNQVWDLALRLPPAQLFYKRALRRALGTYFPELAALPWNKVAGPATVPVAAILLQDVYERAGGVAGRLLPFARGKSHASQVFSDYSSWLKGALRPFVESTLLSDEANAAGLFDPDGLRAVVGDHMEGRLDATTFLGIALPFALWTGMFYTPDSPARPEPLLEVG